MLFYIFINLFSVLLDRSQLDCFIYFGIQSVTILHTELPLEILLYIFERLTVKRANKVLVLL